MATGTNKVKLLIVAAAAGVLPSLSGCTPESYRRSADRQVFALLKDRERAAVAYTPEVAVGPAGQPPPVTKRAYERIPATPVPPPAPSPIEPPVVETPFGPLGPPLPLVEAGPDVEAELRNESMRQVPDEPSPLTDYGPLVYGPLPAPGVRLDLFGALQYAVQNSRQYQDQMEDLYLAALDVTLERHLFTPRPFARAGLEYSGGQADVDYRSALAATANAGVRQRLPYGGEVVAETLVRFVSALNGPAAEGESAQAVLSGSLPLLRGAGLVNLESLIDSERTLIYAVRDFESFRRSFAVQVASQYFNLLTQQQSVANRIQSYRDRANLLERAEALFAAAIGGGEGGRGAFSFLEVQRAQQTLLFAENEVIEARQQYQNALDGFKLLLGMPVTAELDVVAVELDVNVPDVEGVDVLQLAEQYRLDLQTARDRVDDARRGVAVAENGLLPDLDLTGRAQVGNSAGTQARYFNADTLEYSAGVTLDLPVDRLAERNVYRRALIGFDQARRSLEDLRDRVFADVRESLRGIRIAQSTVEIQRRNIELARRRLELSNELLRQGRSDTRDVVEAQDDLLSAQDDYEQAQADLQIQVLQFLRDTGTLRVDPDAGAIGRAMRRVREAEAGMTRQRVELPQQGGNGGRG